LALRVAEASSRWKQIVLLDDDARTHGTSKLGLTVAGPLDRLDLADPARDEVVNLVTRTTRGRSRARERIAAFGLPFASLVHPSVDLLGTEIGEEITLYAQSTLGAGAGISRSSVVLMGGVVGHGSWVEEGCIVAPHAVINARVHLQPLVYVGSNASILPDLTIGEGATIAANSLVVSDVPPGATAIGVPASIVEAREFASGASSLPGRAGASFDGRLGAGVGASAVRLSRASAFASLLPDDLEAELLDIVARVLGRDSVPLDGNFFDVGGTSLKALQLRQQLHGRFGVEVQLVDLYQHPSVRSLAHFLREDAPGADVGSVAGRRAALRRRRSRL
jgi:serine acetyltransferase/acyl carrier protein